MATDSGNLSNISPKEEPQISWEYDCTAKFVCNQCQKTFYNTTALHNHRKMHHGVFVANPDLFNDDYGPCDFKFTPLIPSNMDKLHTRNGVTTCRFLEDTTFLIVRIKKNCKDKTDPEELLLTDSDFKINYQMEESGKQFRGPFTCTYRATTKHQELHCQQIFFNCCEYSLHYREEHTKRRKAALRCQVCEKPLDRDTYVKTTVIPSIRSTAEISQPPASCHICSQTFSDSSDLEEHSRVFHTKPYGCNICAKRFSQQGGLHQHMRLHTGLRPFTCSFCPKAFTQKAGLDQHLRTHTKVKPYKCVICNKCFSQSVHLRQHMRTHTNIQPFECSFCNKRFKQSSHLTFHMRSIHMTEKDDSLVVDRYAQEIPQKDQLQSLGISKVQQVRNGDRVFYAAEMSTSSQSAAKVPFFPFPYQSC